MDETYEKIVTVWGPIPVESVSIHSLIAETDPDEDDEEEDDPDYWRSDLPPIIWARDAVDMVDAGEYPAFPCGAD